ncbi:hypothetical protein KUBF_38090 [Bacteroides finegoldii]|nr:hypothetical protein KUBF_38090 [Bacteroides finegoldii]
MRKKDTEGFKEASVSVNCCTGIPNRYEINLQCLLKFKRLALILHPHLSIEQSINQINNCQNERFITKH